MNWNFFLLSQKLEISIGNDFRKKNCLFSFRKSKIWVWTVILKFELIYKYMPIVEFFLLFFIDFSRFLFSMAVTEFLSHMIFSRDVRYYVLF